MGAPTKDPIGMVLGAAFIACDLLLATVHPIFIVFGIPCAFVGALMLMWQFTGREVVQFDSGNLLIEARIAGTTAGVREFVVADVSRAHFRDGRLVWLRPASASGLPLLVIGGSPLWFDYRGRSYAFGQSLDLEQRVAVLARLAERQSVTEDDVAGSG